MIPKISIICPVYMMRDYLGAKFLVEYFENLLLQTFKDFEVVVTDQSTDTLFEKLCNNYSKYLNIKYYRNNNEIKNAAANVNYGVSKASGEIIKLLYVDDFFVDDKALEKIYNAFQTKNGSWLICGFTHCDENKKEYFDTRMPWYGNKYVNGDNTTGNPSTYAVRRNCAIEMDENLLWVVDGEYFYRSYYHHGDPIIINDILVCFREHSNSAFRDPKLKELELEERKYSSDKFSLMLKRHK